MQFFGRCTCSLATDVFASLKLCELCHAALKNSYIKVQIATHSFIADLLIGIECNMTKLCSSVCKLIILVVFLHVFFCTLFSIYRCDFISLAFQCEKILQHLNNLLYSYVLKHAFSMCKRECMTLNNLLIKALMII